MDHEDPCFLPMPSLLASLRNVLGERCRGSGEAAPEDGEARECEGEGEEVAAEEDAWCCDRCCWEEPARMRMGVP